MIQKKRQGEGAAAMRRGGGGGSENSRWAGQEGPAGQEGRLERVQTSAPLSVSESCESRQILGASLVTQW